MDILVLSDKPESDVLARAGIKTDNVLPFTHPPFDPAYLEENTDAPEEIKLLKARLTDCDSVIVHVLPGQKLTSLIAWGKLKRSDWAHIESATVIREDGDFACEDEMNGRLADLLDDESQNAVEAEAFEEEA